MLFQICYLAAIMLVMLGVCIMFLLFRFFMLLCLVHACTYKGHGTLLNLPGISFLTHLTSPCNLTWVMPTRAAMIATAEPSQVTRITWSASSDLHASACCSVLLMQLGQKWSFILTAWTGAAGGTKATYCTIGCSWCCSWYAHRNRWWGKEIRRLREEWRRGRVGDKGILKGLFVFNFNFCVPSHTPNAPPPPPQSCVQDWFGFSKCFKNKII